VHRVPRISRRDFLMAALAVGGAGLAGCAAPTSPSPSASAGQGPSVSPSASTTIPPSPSPSPEPTQAASPPLSQVVARLLVVGFRGLTVAKATAVHAAIDSGGLGGVILFDRDQVTGEARNVASPDQVRALVGGLAGLAGERRLIVAIDQEGGRVARLTPKYGFPAVESEAAIGATGDEATAATWGGGIAGTLADVGVNLNLAPVVDVNVNPTNPAIGALDRSFSADPAVVARLALAEIRAHHAAGISTALKHFPGLGSATANTDFGVADVTKTWSRKELDPFRAIIEAGEADVVMAGHLVNGQLDADHPASLSRAIVTDLLRGELGWDGLVITDDLGAAAITTAFGEKEAIALAIEAGNDLLLIANQQSYRDDIVTRVADIIEGHVRSGRITRARLEESRERIEAHRW
jgi:beta-N-acetylhexosaminidase